MDLAPELRRTIAREGADRTSLYLGDALRSVRGIEALTALERLDLPAGVKLDPVARLPRLRELHVHAPPGDRRRVARLGPLARARALEELHVHDARAVELEALVHVATLRAVEISFARCPDLRPLAALPLRRLVLDGMRGVHLRQLEGLAVEQLDLWGCGILDLGPLATMPNLREVWIHRDGWERVPPEGRSLEPLMHLPEGAKLVIDDQVDPRDVERLQARGVWVFADPDPHEHGVEPSWWGCGFTAP